MGTAEDLLEQAAKNKAREGELKGRALREAAESLQYHPQKAPPEQHNWYVKWLMDRAELIESGNDPAIPEEPMTAGSLAFTRDGTKYLRWCDGSSHTSSPWLRTMEHADDFYRYADLDVVRVIAGPEEWPT